MAVNCKVEKNKQKRKTEFSLEFGYVIDVIIKFEIIFMKRLESKGTQNVFILYYVPFQPTTTV